MTELFAPARDATWHTGNIMAAVDRTHEQFIEVGRRLAKAKAELPHGEFVAMVREKLPFDERQAQRLMAIAADPKLSDATRVSLLPASIGALYELTRVPTETVDRAVAAGKLGPNSTRREVVEVVRHGGDVGSSPKAESWLPTDGLGNMVAREDVGEAFKALGHFNSVLGHLSAARAALKKHESDAAFDACPVQDAIRAITEAYNAVKASRPYVITPANLPPNSKAAWAKRGWLTKQQHDNLPPEYRWPTPEE